MLFCIVVGMLASSSVDYDKFGKRELMLSLRFPLCLATTGCLTLFITLNICSL